MTALTEPDEPGYKARVGGDARPERAGDRDDIPGPPQGGDHTRGQRGPQWRRVEDDDATESLGMCDAEQKRGEPAPVVADEPHALEPERVEQCQRIGCIGEWVIPVPRCLAPAKAAQIRHEQPILSG